MLTGESWYFRSFLRLRATRTISSFDWCLRKHMNTGLGLSPCRSLAARERWARSRCGGVCNTWSPNISIRAEKKVVGRGPSMDSRRPIILKLLCRLRPSRSMFLVLSLAQASDSVEHDASRAWMRPSVELVMVSELAICLPKSITVARTVSNLASREANQPELSR